MGYGTLAISGFRYWLGNLHGEHVVQGYTKVGKRFFNDKKNVIGG
jgi:hypothetical protein